MKHILLLLLLILSCRKTAPNVSDCSKIREPFASFQDAISTVEYVHFNFSEEVDTSKSSWIRSAKYYSCDGVSGYFLYTTDKETYIHQNVPIEIWEGFKDANSFGSYYNENIKHRYQLVPDGQ